MGGFAVEDLDGKRYRLSATKLMDGFNDGSIPLPTITKEEIADKSKADWVVKTLVSVQVLWFLLQLLGRAVQNLPVTTLELFTLAIISCAIVTYSLWWMKPLDIFKPVVIKLTTAPSQRLTDMRHISISESTQFLNTYHYYMPFIGIVCILFGTCHAIGWNFEFATDTEKILWRIASISCAGLPIGIFLTSLLPEPWDENVIRPLAALLFIVRLYLLVEIFVGLRAVPAAVYQTVQWSLYFPHI